MLLSRDDILKADDIRTETVPVPEWGGDVLVRGLSGRERDTFEASMLVERGGRMEMDPRNARARLATMCVVGEDGKPLFTRDDMGALGEKSAAALNRVFDVASRLSGLGESDMKELQGNFGSAPEGPSPGGGGFSGSPNGSA